MRIYLSSGQNVNRVDKQEVALTRKPVLLLVSLQAFASPACSLQNTLELATKGITACFFGSWTECGQKGAGLAAGVGMFSVAKLFPWGPNMKRSPVSLNDHIFLGSLHETFQLVTMRDHKPRNPRLHEPSTRAFYVAFLMLQGQKLLHCACVCACGC